MLKSTFQHLKGVGEKKEYAFWKKGILTWDDYERIMPKQYSLFGDGFVDSPLQETIAAYNSDNMDYFAEILTPKDYYRVALEYPEEVLFLDIETTGLSLYYDIITIIGWSIGKEFGIYLNGHSDIRFKEALKRAKVIVTFNGTMFDLKFIKKHFGSIEFPKIHLDLRFFSKRVGFSGGQKAIENQIGFTRATDIEGMLGEAAPILWHKYRRGDQDAMRRLIEYNHADIEGMKAILDKSIALFYTKEKIPKSVQKKPKFSKLKSKILWAKRAPKLSSSQKIFIPPYTGDNKPLITYADLSEKFDLANFCTVGIDLVSSEERETGFCILKGNHAETCRVKTDEEMIQLVLDAGANLVSIDSPLSIPEGRTSFFDDDPHRDEFGITRECERTLKKRGISSYPCLIPSMQKLTQRGMLLTEKFRSLGIPVIESYPGAAQDIMSIPRKQAGLDYLVEGLKDFGISGEFLQQTVSHDELDAITSAIVGHFFWVGLYEGLGNTVEGYLIIPDLNANHQAWLHRKVIGLSGSLEKNKRINSLLERMGYSSTHIQKIQSNLKSNDKNHENKDNALFIEESTNNEWSHSSVLDISNSCFVVDGIDTLKDHALMVETFGPSFCHFHIAKPWDMSPDNNPDKKPFKGLDVVAHYTLNSEMELQNFLEKNTNRFSCKDDSCR